MVADALVAEMMVAEVIALAVLVLATGAEAAHIRRCRRMASLTFGPQGRPAIWVWTAPLLKVLSLAGVTWGLVTLLLLTPKVHKAEAVPEDTQKHLMVVLDVSPSMRLQDAGPTKEQGRMRRAADVMKSFFDRVPIEQYRISVVAFYSGAIPVVIDTRDMDVVNNIFNDLPMHYAFKKGKTDIFAGLEHAAEAAKHWNPQSTMLVLISDGDTVPAMGMPKMPVSISDVLVVGVGDAQSGSFIDGHHSRQDVSHFETDCRSPRGTFSQRE